MIEVILLWHSVPTRNIMLQSMPQDIRGPLAAPDRPVRPNRTRTDQTAKIQLSTADLKGPFGMTRTWLPAIMEVSTDRRDLLMFSFQLLRFSFSLLVCQKEPWHESTSSQSDMDKYVKRPIVQRQIISSNARDDKRHLDRAVRPMFPLSQWRNLHESNQVGALIYLHID